MPEQFDRALDKCIDQLLREGKSVEQCLAQYPELAAELEAPLRAFARLQTAPLSASPAAKERGRLRLQQELQALERADRTRSAKPSWSTLLWRNPRMRVVSALGSLALLLGIGAPGLVAASNGTVPGDTLYPLKRGLEETRLALQFSSEGKAGLHLNYADRRAVEIAKLVEGGESTDLAAAQKALTAQLASASSIASDLKDDKSAEVLRTRIEGKTAKVLTRLQDSVLQASDDSSRAAAQDSLNTASQASSAAVEKAVARAPVTSRTAAAGSVVVGILNRGQNTGRIDSLLITVTDFSAYLVAGQQSAWVTLLPGPSSIDLVQPSANGSLFAQASLPAGSYSKLRLQVQQAALVIDGRSTPVQVPDEPIVLSRPFRVVAAQATALYIDVNPASLLARNNGQVELKPRLLIFALQPGDFDISKLPTPAVSTPKARPTAVKGSLEQSSSTPPAEGALGKIDLRGTVQALSGSTFLVNGTRVKLAPDANVEGTLEVGALAQVHSAVQSDGSLLALSVQFVPAGSTTTPRPAIATATAITPGKPVPPNPTPSPSSVPRPTPTAAKEPEPTLKPPPTVTPALPAVTVHLEGRIEALSLGTLRVASDMIQITTSTKIEGVPRLNALVEVDGTRLANGMVLATSIRVRPEQIPKALSPTATSTATRALTAAPTRAPVIPTTPSIPGVPTPGL